MTYKEKLVKRLKAIEDKFVEILESSSIQPYSQKPNPFSSFSGRPQTPKTKYKWTDLDIDLERKQHQISMEFEEWYIDFSYLLHKEPPRIKAKLNARYSIIDVIIKHRSFGRMPTSIMDAISSFHDELKPFYSYLSNQTTGNEAKIFIIDTNVIIDAQDISQYPLVLGQDLFTCIIVPVIIEELDELKIKIKDRPLLKKVSDAIRYIKGLSKLGDAIRGVNITENIKIILRAREANFSELPDWLNENNRDDRIVSSAIEISRENPDSQVIVLSNDTNMHTKCTLAGISCSDFDLGKLEAP